MINLANLPIPKAIELVEYTEVLENIKALFIRLLGEEYTIIESDKYSALLEVLAYREVLLRARINAAVKATLLPTATGSDLDNVVSLYGITRLEGAKPTATVGFYLTLAQDRDVTIPQDTVLNDSEGNVAMLKKDVIITAGSLSATGTTELQKKTVMSTIKCELVQTPLPFLVQAKQTTNFTKGSEVESDEALRNRAVLSLHRFSTAGARESYIYHALSANAKIEEVSVLNGGAGIVKVYIKSTDEDTLVLEDVKTALNADKVRPLTDNVVVLNATKMTVNISAEVELINMLAQNDVDRAIKSELSKNFKIGEDLNISFIYKALHKEGVYRARLTAPALDTKVGESEYIKIGEIKLTYKKAEL